MEATVSQAFIQAAATLRAQPHNLRGTSLAQQTAARHLKIGLFLWSTAAGCRKPPFSAQEKSWQSPLGELRWPMPLK